MQCAVLYAALARRHLMPTGGLFFGISAWRDTYESTLRIGGTIDIVFQIFKSKDTFTQSSSIPIVSSLARIYNLLRIPTILQLTHYLR